MQHDFSNANLDFQDFIDTYLSCITVSSTELTVTITGLYEKVFATFSRPFDEEELIAIYEELAHYKVTQEIPYTILSNEIYTLKNLLIGNLNENLITTNTLNLLHLFQNINNRIAKIYLIEYIEKLVAQNSVRTFSVSDLVEKNIIVHYESHLLWLTELAQHIKDVNRQTFPELDDKACEFGKWLHGDAKQIISNNSKYKNIIKLHKNLHLFASKIFHILDKDEYHILITYLEKCELISLSIGTELALLDQILINKKITKDCLTGALNRNGLDSIFESQYELALATSNSFIVAMCDLDFFKNINDTYGHIAGDKLLKLFVDTVAGKLRNSDVIIRYGGEEFLIMLPTIHKEKGYEVLDEIRSEFSNIILEFNNEKISATVSIGMIEITPEALFKKSFINEYLMKVDKNLYLAKDNGRNRVKT
ncbi:MAG: sensor domain-containing diguanylate cyclase [Campylobacterota bacterium]|nr:sensor domain-containing diguanylate cyclase [Campylobacterota bacterium]